MRLCKLAGPAGEPRVGLVEDDQITVFSLAAGTLAEILASSSPATVARDWAVAAEDSIPLATARLLAPIDQQEVWAAGVTYKRSQAARMDESKDAASFYDKVYTAQRPELFFKASPHRVAGPGEPVRIRQDTDWSVPEPEITLVLAPDLRIVGYTAGNDMSARDIEGANPLYLPQAKVYSQCASLGPVVTLPEAMPALQDVDITLVIERAGSEAFRGQTQASQMKRSFRELVDWLGRDNSFPNGAFLMTGTGIVPPDHLSLQAGDKVTISITGIGTLENPVVKAKP